MSCYPLRMKMRLAEKEQSASDSENFPKE